MSKSNQKPSSSSKEDKATEPVNQNDFMSDDQLINHLTTDANEAPPPGATRSDTTETDDTETTEQWENMYSDEFTTPEEGEPFTPTNDDLEGFAEMIVEGMQFIRSELVAPTYKQLELSKHSPALIKHVSAQMRLAKQQGEEGVYIHPSPEEQEVIDSFTTCVEFDEKAVYSEDQRKKYVQRFKDFFIEMNWHIKVPAWAKLGFVALTLEGPLVMSVYRKKKEVAKLKQSKNKGKDVATTEK